MKKFLPLTLLSLFLLSSSPIFAWESTTITAPPPYELLSARGYQDIFSTGDVLIVSRFHLTQDETSTDWCDLLKDTTGCASTPVNPNNPESLDVDSITGYSPMLYELYTGIGVNRILQKQTADIPRINRGLIGFYISDGSASGVPYGGLNTQICLQANKSIWSNAATSSVGSGCRNMVWSGGKEQLINDLKTQVSLLEDELVLPKYTLLSEARLITYSGSKFVDEAVPLLSRTIGEAFSIGGGRAITEIPPTPTGLALQASLDTEYQASPMSTHVDTVASDYFGISGRVFITIITMFLALLAGGVMYTKTGNGSLSFISMMSIATVSVFFNGVSVGVLFTMLAIGSLVAAGFFLRKMPN
ncbi:MAG: hypothetical protein CL881_02055 [Dehalococcoidia bacterium]|nr:hypothetical protein [Dehalococcoidia bacterium]